MSNAPDFPAAVTRWLRDEPRIVAAVLFGSTARAQTGAGPADRARADLDIHSIATDAAGLERVDWTRALPDSGFILAAVRPATGGVRKVTALFRDGELDLVLVPADRAAQVRAAMAAGAHRAAGELRTALNELATCLQTGHRMLKGEAEWGSFYAQALAELPGVRMSDDEIRNAADIFLCDLAWVRQKLRRGELRAAQHLLHRSLSETAFRFLRELRLRRGEPLPSFGLGRRVEQLLLPTELEWVTVSARLDRDELAAAADRAFSGLQSLVLALGVDWTVPQGYRDLRDGSSSR